MKKLFLLTLLFIGIPSMIMAEPGGPGSNPGTPFATIEADLERNYQATQEIPGVVVDNVRDLIPPVRLGAKRWVSPNWEQSQSNQSGSVHATRTTIYVFNPDRLYSATVNVSAYLPDGSEFTSGFGATVPATLTVPPFGQAALTIQDSTGLSYRGSVVIEADGPVIPDGEITRRNFSADSGHSRTMAWYPDNASEGQDPQDTLPPP